MLSLEDLESVCHDSQCHVMFVAEEVVVKINSINLHLAISKTAVMQAIKDITQLASHALICSTILHQFRGLWIAEKRSETITAWNEAYIMLVSCIDYALDMTCIQSVSQCFIVGGIL